MILLRLLFLYFFLITTLNIFAIEVSSDFQVNSLRNIPAKDVNCIFHDSRGFMWIGTLDGLHRFDGYTYKTYRIEPSKNSISSNLIIALDEDSKGNIWIGTYGKGVCKLNPETDDFTSYENKSNDPNGLPNDVNSLIIDKNDVLWTVNWYGISRIELDSAMCNVVKSEIISLDAQGYDENVVIKTIFQDKNDTFWIGTNTLTARILNPYDSAKNIVFEIYPSPSESICDFENGVLVSGFQINALVKSGNANNYQVQHISNESAFQVLYHDKQIWSGNRTGITCFEKAKNGNWEIVKRLQKNFTDQSLNSNITTSLVNDDVGQIWYGTRGGGVNLIKSTPERFQHYMHTLNPGSVSNDMIMSIFEDSYENLWIGTEEQGVSFLKKGRNYAKGFKNLQVNDLASENRVYAIEETHTPGSEKHKSIIWTGTSHPLFLAAYDPETLEPIMLPEEVRDIGHIFSLENQDDSILWAGTYGNGLWRLSLDNKGQITNMRNFIPNTLAGKGMLSVIIRNIFKDSKGNIWISTDKGLNRLSKKESVKDSPYFEAFTIGNDNQHLSHDYILQVMETQNGNIWIGTMGGGLIHYTENVNRSYSFTTVSSQDGLPNNTIKSIVEDEKGFLWLSSNKGLTKYNPNDGNIINYDIADGLQDNDFSEICGLQRKNGEIIFGGINGFNVFKTHQLSIDKTKPRLYFTDFLILNKEIQKGDLVDNKEILTKTIEFTRKIELKYDHNSFSIGFAGIQYNAPQKHNYRYKLEGFDKEWYKASPDYRLAKYTNIPDGKYTFKVMGSNSDNIWVDEPIELQIIVKPPRYRSPLAIGIYIVLLLILGIIITRVVKEIMQRRKDVMLANIEKEKVEEISKLRLQFFTNISHEFRTPLSLIATPLDQLIREGEKTNSKNQQYNLNLIKHNVGIMMRLITQLLDFRKLDQHKLQLQPSSQSLNQFLRNIYQAFEVLAKQKNISYSFYPYSGGDDIWIDVDKMEKVIYNLLSNAFKYTGNNGRVILKADADLTTNQYVIYVSDTGIGIDPEEEIHIFERYYRVTNKKKSNIGGTGIGLALAKGFVELHQGEIGFHPNVDEGTVFFVKLRMGNAHFPQEILMDPQELSPMAAPKYEPPMVELPEDKQKADSKHLPKMLVVEDNFDLRKQIKNIFRDEYRVYEADDGSEGLKKSKELLPDIIVTDVMMPNMDGMEMCRKIKEEEEISHIPIMILTAKNTEDTIVEGYDLGADGYVMKPFSVDVLKARVNSLVRNREQLRARFQKEIEINPKIISNTPADSKFLDKILNFIETNLSDSDYSVEQLAADYGVSRIYLNRKIRGLTGETTIEFMRNIKLKHAAELLKQNKLNVTEVAWEIGYNDIRTFRKRFKEKFELSPSEFAKQFKE